MTPKVAGALATNLATLPPSSTILLRRARKSVANEFEQFVSVLAKTLGHSVEWCVPDTGGRAATFSRDVQMAARADIVLAFFDTDHIMEGGTGHLVEKASEAERVCYAYSIDEEGNIGYIGSHMPA